MDANDWTPQNIMLVLGGVATLLTTLTTSIIAVIRAARAEGKTDALGERVNSQGQSIRDNRQATTQLAIATNTVSATLTPVNPAPSPITDENPAPVPNLQD